MTLPFKLRLGLFIGLVLCSFLPVLAQRGPIAERPMELPGERPGDFRTLPGFKPQIDPFTGMRIERLEQFKDLGKEAAKEDADISDIQRRLDELTIKKSFSTTKRYLTPRSCESCHR